MKTLISAILSVVIVLTAGQTFSADTKMYNNDNALKGMQGVKVYFDISLGDAPKLLLRMQLVDRTIRQLEESGVRVKTVIGIRGGASRYITRAEHYVLDDEIEYKKKIQGWISTFAKQGITIEQCIIAAEILDIEPGDFLPEVELVKNGYVSLVGYQAQGFGVIPMD